MKRFSIPILLLLLLEAASACQICSDYQDCYSCATNGGVWCYGDNQNGSCHTITFWNDDYPEGCLSQPLGTTSHSECPVPCSHFITSDQCGLANQLSYGNVVCAWDNEVCVEGNDPTPQLDLPSEFVPDAMDPLDQGECASCFAFASAKVIQGKYNKQNQKIMVSPNQFAFCGPCKACEGGYFSEALDLYTNGTGILMSLKDSPYSYPQTCTEVIAHGNTLPYEWTGVDYYTLGIDTYPHKYETSPICAEMTSPDFVKSFLVHEGYLAIGLMVYEDFYNLDPKKPYVYDGESAFVGYHAVTLIGYTSDGFIVSNSWGVHWGDKGLFLLPFNSTLVEWTNVCGFVTTVVPSQWTDGPWYAGNQASNQTCTEDYAKPGGWFEHRPSEAHLHHLKPAVPEGHELYEVSLTRSQVVNGANYHFKFATKDAAGNVYDHEARLFQAPGATAVLRSRTSIPRNSLSIWAWLGPLVGVVAIVVASAAIVVVARKRRPQPVLSRGNVALNPLQTYA